MTLYFEEWQFLTFFVSYKNELDMFVLRYLWAISMLLVLAVLLLLHGFSGNTIYLEHSTSVPKETFFYSVLVVIVLAAGCVLTLGNTVSYLPKRILIVPKRSFWLKNKNTKLFFVKKFKAWIKGLGMIFNFFLMVCLGMIAQTNIEASPQFPINAYFISVSVMAIGWLVFFFFLFQNTNTTKEKLGAAAE